MFWTLLYILAAGLLVGAFVGWLARGASDAHHLADGCRDAAQRTPKPIPGREQFLRDLRGEGAKRDGPWWSRRRRDREERKNRRRA